MTKSKRVAIENILLDEGCQVRVELSNDAVAEYAEAYTKDARCLPPVSVFQVGDSLYLVDGFHRIAAAHQAGVSFLTCETVGSGTLDEAQWHALSVNQTHGLRRTNADKHRAVELALGNGIGIEQSSAVIAERCGVGVDLVSKVRAKVEACPPERVLGKDGVWRKRPARKPNTNPSVLSVNDSEAPNPAESLDPDFENADSADSDDVADESGTHDKAHATAVPYDHDFAAALTKAAQLISSCKRGVKSLLAGFGGQETVEADALSHLSQARYDLSCRVPTLCVECSGDGCKWCDRRGWLARSEAKRLQERLEHLRAKESAA